MSKVTERPWDSNTMLSEHDYKYAAFCVNNHERLVSALDSAATVLEIAGYVDTASNHRTLLATLEAEKGGEL